MKNIISALVDLFREYSISEEERYLSQSVSNEDLERRIKLIERGEASYQLYR